MQIISSAADLAAIGGGDVECWTDTYGTVCSAVMPYDEFTDWWTINTDDVYWNDYNFSDDDYFGAGWFY